MNQITEVLQEKPSVLLVAKKHNHILNLLKRQLKKYNADVFLSPELPAKLDRFQYCFIFNPELLPKKKLFTQDTKLICLFINKPRLADQFEQNLQKLPLKVVSLTGNSFNDTHIDRLIWFALSRSNEIHLKLNTFKSVVRLKTPWFKINLRIPKRRQIILAGLYTFLLLHLAFVPPLLISSFFTYQSALALKQEQDKTVSKYLKISQVFFGIAKKIYTIPRSTFLLFSFTFPDYFFEFNQRTLTTIQTVQKLQTNTKAVLQLVLKKNKSREERQSLILRLDTIKDDIDLIEDSLNFLIQQAPASSRLFFLTSSSTKLQNLKDELYLYLDLLTRFKKIVPRLDSILAKDSEKTYLLLFANNMELRPGGGFIGSFGVVKVKDLTIDEIRIYDVYDANGQLIAHVEPPSPIREYLSQPNWFLRDSAFSADFLENYAQAKYFLEKEMGFTNFSGSILITTTAIQSILAAFGEIYLPDFREKITKQNFYLKTQYQVEKDFFPGSIQKKNFLSSLTSALLLELENASVKLLFKELKKSLDSKQIAIYIDDSEIQPIFDRFYWSGRILQSSCVTGVDYCIDDHIFPLDANLGLNKVNFFVSRTVSLKINIDDQGKFINSFLVKFNNDSTDSFPGGIYRNYFQLLLPRSSLVKSVSVNNQPQENFSQTVDRFKKIGILLEIQPKSITELKVDYELAPVLKKGKNIYQLITQKQIGASDSDLTLELSFPKKTHLVNQNFPALAKNNRILYNTSLSADKIFLLELVKE